MIKKHELRIGNIVNCHFLTTNFNAEVLEVRHGGVMVQDGEYQNVYGYDNISPLQISPEILEKAGFVKNPHVGWRWGNINGVYSIENWWSVTEVEGEWLFGFDEIDEGFVTLTSLKYLHQLQNLYFALAKEELTIQL